MSHQEKQRIFDEYAKSKVIESWEVLTYSIPVEDLIVYTYEACDLVQAEQQKRIAENAKIQYESCGDSMTCGCMGRCDYPVSYINKKSIINPENLIS